MTEIRQCTECRYKLDDGYDAAETLCGACYNEIHNIDQDDFSIGEVTA